MQRLGWVLCVALLACGAAAAEEKPPIILGLQADMSSGAAEAGEAIRRGMLIAISEINAGLLRTYRPPFTPTRHAAMELSDYRLTTFSPEGILVPSQP